MVLIALFKWAHLIFIMALGGRQYLLCFKNMAKKWPVQGHRASRWQQENSTLGWLAPETVLLNLYFVLTLNMTAWEPGKTIHFHFHRPLSLNFETSCVRISYHHSFRLPMDNAIFKGCPCPAWSRKDLHLAVRLLGTCSFSFTFKRLFYWSLTTKESISH